MYIFHRQLTSGSSTTSTIYRAAAWRTKRAARWTGRALHLFIVLMMTLLPVAPLGAMPAYAEGEALTAMPLDAAPDETVFLSGSGFEADASYDLSVLLPDSSIASDSVLADADGAFTVEYLPAGGDGAYVAMVYPAGDSSTALASASFTVTTPPPPIEEPTPTEEPTAVPTAEPTAEPTVVPTDAPTAVPTAVPTEEPTAEPTPSVPPTIASDKADYAPGELVTLNGAYWQAGESVNIYVNDDVGQTWNHTASITATENGTFIYSFNLPEWFVAVYSVTAYGAISGEATTTFTDTLVPSNQIDGFTAWNPLTDSWSTAGAQNAYAEKGVVPFRVSLKDVEEGEIYTVAFGMDLNLDVGGALGFSDTAIYNVTEKPTSGITGTLSSATADGFQATHVGSISSYFIGFFASQTDVTLSDGETVKLGPGYQWWEVSFTPDDGDSSLRELINLEVVVGGILAGYEDPIKAAGESAYKYYPIIPDTVPLDQGAAQVGGVFQAILGNANKTVNFKGSDIIIPPDIFVAKKIDRDYEGFFEEAGLDEYSFTIYLDDDDGVKEIDEGGEDTISTQTLWTNVLGEVRFIDVDDGTYWITENQEDEPLVAYTFFDVQILNSGTPQGIFGEVAQVTVYAGASGSGGPQEAEVLFRNELNPLPLIMLEKIGTLNDDDGTLGVSAGDTISYAFTVTNDGNVTLANVTLADTVGGVTIYGDPILSLAVGAVDSTTFTGSYTLIQADIDAGHFYNLATVTGTPPIGDDVTDTDDHDETLPKDPSMTVEKTSVTTSLAAPGTVTYSYLVTNTGNVTLTGISLVDDNDEGDMSCPATTLDPGVGMTCTATHTFTQAELDANGSPTAGSTNLVNNVTASSNEAPDATDDLSIPITYAPAIQVVKSSTTTLVTEADQVVPYEFVVTNEGNVTLTGITVIDTKCDATPTYVSGDLPEGFGDGKLQLTETWTYTCSHTVTQAEMDAATGLDPQLHNLVTADSTESEEDTDEYDIPIDYDPLMTVEKTSVTTSLAAPGTVTYSYLVTNTGNVTLTGISLVDDNDEGDMSCPATTLDPGVGMTCTATHTFTQAELDANGSPTAGSTNLVNNVTASSNEAPDATDDLSIPITYAPAIQVVKSSTTTLVTEADQVVPYEFVVTNEGNVTLTGITVIDTKCDATPTYVSGDLPEGFGDGKLQLTETWTYTCSHTVTQAEMDAATGLDPQLHNLVTADSTESEEDTDEYDIPIDYDPLMTVEKTSVTTSLAAPGTVTYSYLVTNTGNVTLTGISLVDDNDEGDMSCPATTLDPGVGMTCTATHTFTQAELDANGSPTAGSTNLVNNVTASSNEAPDATDDLSIPITYAPAIQVVKSSTTTLVTEADQVVPYEFVVTNEGNVTLTGITVIDTKCDATPTYVSGDLPEGFGDGKLQLTETWTYTCSHTVTQAEMDAATGLDPQLHNLVTADSTESEEDTDEYDIPIDYDPLMTVEKTSVTTSLAAPGTVTYSYLVTNTGNVTLTGISLVDDNDEGDMSCPATTLDPGVGMTCTATHTFTQAELDANGSPTAGSTNLVNNVTASSNEAPDATDDLSIPITYAPAIQVVKSSTTTLVTEADQVVPYEFVVTNEGNVTLTGITVIDTKCDATPTYVSGDLPEGFGDGKLQLTETWTYTCSHTVTQAEMDAATGLDPQLHNLVTADSTESEEDTDEYDIPIDYDPLMTVEKTSVTTSLAAPGTVTYSYLVTNTGNVTLTGISLVDDNDEGDMSCPATTLDPGVGMTCTATHTFTQAELDANGSPTAGSTNLVNNVTASSNEAPDATDDLSIPITYAPAIQVVKSSTTTLVTEADQVVPYEFVVTNEGNVTLTGITVIDTKCDATPTYVSGDLPEGFGDGKLQLTETWTYTCSHTVTQAEMDAGGTLDNTGTADSDETGPVSDDLSIPIEQDPLLSIVKTASPLTYDSVGDVISYSYLVTNTGNVTISGQITVSDDIATDESCPVGDLAPGGSLTCTASYTITQGDLDAGFVTNVAFATGTDPGGNPVNSPNDDETVDAIQNPDFVVSKGCSSEPVPQTGPATYSVTVNNIGNVTLTKLLLTDLPSVGVATITCPSGNPIPSLEVGAVETCTVSVDGSLFTGHETVDNTVTATSTFNYWNGTPTMISRTASASCWVAGEVEIIKLTQGLPNEPPNLTTQSWTFTLQDCGTNGCEKDDLIIKTVTSPPSEVNFGVDLVPIQLESQQTYRLCEALIPAAWTNVWMGDLTDDGTPETFIPFVPAVSDDLVVNPPGWSGVFDPLYLPPPNVWDNSERCLNFAVDAGQTEVFQINNEFPGGEPRTIGYWKNWNSCTGGGQVQTAIDSGGETPAERLANGYALLDDVLQAPGITIGFLPLIADDDVFGCDLGTQDAVNILDKRDVDKSKKRAADAAYGLASQLLAAIANDSAGAEVCKAAGQAVIDGQLLLVGIGFNGEGGFFDKKVVEIEGFTKQEANDLAGILDLYNNGTLCVP